MCRELLHLKPVLAHAEPSFRRPVSHTAVSMAAAAAFLAALPARAQLTRPSSCRLCSSRGARVARASIAPSDPPKTETSQPSVPSNAPWHSAPPPQPGDRTATVLRSTRETSVKVYINVDGGGFCSVSTGIGFLDHMLSQIAAHGLFDLAVTANGDTWIDDHHTNEDVGISLGMALAQALGSKAGIRRFGQFAAPLDEALVDVVLDFSGRPYLAYGLDIPTEKIGKFDTQLVKEFYAAVAANAQCTLHVRQKAGENSHHIVEASFKAFARAMRVATEIDPRRAGQVPSSKGTLTDQQALAGQF